MGSLTMFETYEVYNLQGQKWYMVEYGTGYFVERTAKQAK